MILALFLFQWSCWIQLLVLKGVSTNALDIWSVATANAHQVSSEDLFGSVSISSTHEGMPIHGDVNSNNKQKNVPLQTRELLIPSPKCWQTAIAILQKTQQEMFSEDASELCARLPEIQQKRLALEIAQCHFHDLSRPLFITESIQRECSYNSISHNNHHFQQATSETYDQQQHLQYCLKHLTDAGVTVYTTYVAFVQNLCIRLTQELILHYQRESQRDLATHLDDWLITTAQQIQSITNLSQLYADQAAEITETVTQQMDDISNMYKDQLHTLAMLPDLVKEQLTQELTEHLGETLQTKLDNELKDTIGKIMAQQVQEQGTFFADLMDRLQLRDTQHQTLYDEWTHYQLTMMQQQALELQRQRQMLDEHRHEMEHWSATMKPLFGLNHLAHLATDGYTWITFLLHFLCTFLIVWVVTRPEVCQPFRSILFGVALSEAILEISLSAGVHYELWTEMQRLVALTELRKWSFFVEAFLYVFGLLVNGIFSIRMSSPSSSNVVSVTAANKNDENREAPVENNGRSIRVRHEHSSSSDRMLGVNPVYVPTRFEQSLEVDYPSVHFHDVRTSGDGRNGRSPTTTNPRVGQRPVIGYSRTTIPSYSENVASARAQHGYHNHDNDGGGDDDNVTHPYRYRPHHHHQRGLSMSLTVPSGSAWITPLSTRNDGAEHHYWNAPIMTTPNHAPTLQPVTMVPQPTVDEDSTRTLLNTDNNVLVEAVKEKKKPEGEYRNQNTNLNKRHCSNDDPDYQEIETKRAKTNTMSMDDDDDEELEDVAIETICLPPKS